MNKKDKAKIKTLSGNIETLKTEFESIWDQEEDKLHNLPDSLADSEIAENLQDGIYSLEEIIDRLNDILDIINVSIL